MSYIYEALKRAEDERQHGPVTARPAAARPLAFATRPPWWMWGLLAALAANVVALVVFTVGRSQRTESPAPVTAAIVEQSAPPVVAQQPAPPPAAALPVAAPRLVEPTPPVAAPIPTRVERVQPTVPARIVPRAERRELAAAAAPVAPRVTPVAPPAPAAAPTPPPAPVAAPTPAPTPPVPATPPPARVTAAPAPRSSVPVAPREASPAPAAAPAPVTRLEPSPGPVVVAPVPPAAASAIELRLQAHVYSETPSQRMVFIDGRRYGEGDRIDGDTVLERITAEGAVVNRRGQRFTISDRR